jgi:hypothetical protein
MIRANSTSTDARPDLDELAARDYVQTPTSPCRHDAKAIPAK